MARRIESYAEHVVHGRVRHEYLWTQRAGMTTWVKRWTRRRERREAQVDVERQLREER